MGFSWFPKHVDSTINGFSSLSPPFLLPFSSLLPPLSSPRPHGLIYPVGIVMASVDQKIKKKKRRKFSKKKEDKIEKKKKKEKKITTKSDLFRNKRDLNPTLQYNIPPLLP